MFDRFSRLALALFIAIIISILFSGCSAQAAREGEKQAAASNAAQIPGSDEKLSGPKIDIEANSPADTVRVFYKNLHDKKFREAMYLTNMRPAMEGLTDAELNEFQVDFNDVAARVPQEIEINGEVISGETAIVTANLPGDDPEMLEIQKLKLRRENGVWLLLTVDEKAEAMIKKEGKNYFYALRLDTHQDEAKKLLQKIADVQTAVAMQNDGKYSDMQTLLDRNLLPADIQTAESTGYNFALKLSDDKKSYFATATPAVCGKTGKLSFLLEVDKKNVPGLSSKDNGGLAIKK